MYNRALKKLTPENTFTLSKITDTSTSCKNEFNYVLRLNEQVSLPKKGDSYIVKYDVDENDNLVLNPYLSLINGTDLLITKGIPEILITKYEIKFKSSNTKKIKVNVIIETSSDGVTYERIKHLPGNKWVAEKDYKNILLFIFLLDFTEFPAGTYIRLKVVNIGDNEVNIVPVNHAYPERRSSAELRLRLDI